MFSLFKGRATGLQNSSKGVTAFIKTWGQKMVLQHYPSKTSIEFFPLCCPYQQDSFICTTRQATINTQWHFIFTQAPFYFHIPILLHIFLYSAWSWTSCFNFLFPNIMPNSERQWALFSHQDITVDNNQTS